MNSPRWKKVVYDLRDAPLRTLMVVLSIAIGVFAFGTISIAQTTIVRELHTAFLATNPASATIGTSRFDEELVQAVRQTPGVSEAQGRHSILVRTQVGPGRWYDLRLFVIPNDGQVRVGRVTAARGIWPPPRRTLLIEGGSLEVVPAEPGDTLTIHTLEGTERALRVVGVARDLSVLPARATGQAYGYISLDTLPWLGEPRGYTQLQIVADHPQDTVYIRAVAERVSDKIRRSGRTPGAIDIPPPQKHPAEDMLPALMLTLGTLGALVLLIAAFLIVNTTDAIIVQQTRQIGVMKAIGARDGQIIGLYLSMVLTYGLLALALAVPLGALGALAFSQFMAAQLNFELTRFTLPPSALLTQVAAGLLVPLLASLPVLRRVTRITVREAMAGGGIAGGSRAARRLDVGRVLGRVPRPLALSLRNTFRRKGRLARTLAALTLGGAVFISVLALRASLLATVTDSIAAKRYDADVLLSRPYRREQAELTARQVAGVEAAEGWETGIVYPLRANGSEGEAMTLYAGPVDSTLVRPRLDAGRWLLPGKTHEIVVSANFLAKAPGTTVGDLLRLNVESERSVTEWRIVGIAHEFLTPLAPAIGYVAYEEYAAVSGRFGYVNSVRVAMASHDMASQAHLASALNDAFDRAGLRVRIVKTTTQDLATLVERFNLLTVVLGTLAILTALVGGMGLTGTMGINVIERTREIGVMRAIGASDRAIRGIIVAEGMVIGVLAWALGVLLSFPLSYLMSLRFGASLLGQALSYRYAPGAVLVWLVLIGVLAALASLAPARRAARLTVREVLAYE
jgi:putative ABC transport system permease protein